MRFEVQSEIFADFPGLILGVLVAGNLDNSAGLPDKKEVVYSDDLHTLCRRWNWRESDITKFTHSTNRACLVLEGLSPVSRQEMLLALKDLEVLISEYCGGQSRAEIIDNSNPYIELL